MKVLIVDQMHPSIVDMLREVDMEADYQPYMRAEEILQCIGNYEGLIIRSKMKLQQTFFEKAQKLRFIGRAGSGLELIDLSLANQKGIEVINAPEGNRDAVAEHALGMLLMLFNHLKRADAEVRQYIWQREANRGLELKGKTVGIIGYGNVGKEFAKRLTGFSCRVLAYDHKKKGYGDAYAEEATMQQIFEEVDVLSLHVSINEESTHLVNDAYLQSFKKNIFLINTSRGEVIDLAALQKALQHGKVRGACLDVLENEKISILTPSQKETFDWLSKAENVLFSPHIAGWTQESYLRINEVLIDKLKSLVFV
ncbi:MAG: NAD(P)-dependent oxidoreductase [Thermonemataceae bacterium]